MAQFNMIGYGSKVHAWKPRAVTVSLDTLAEAHVWIEQLQVLYCVVLYCIALHCIVLYCIVLYCIVLYCIVRSSYASRCVETVGQLVSAEIYWLSGCYNLIGCRFGEEEIETNRTRRSNALCLDPCKLIVVRFDWSARQHSEVSNECMKLRNCDPCKHL